MAPKGSEGWPRLTDPPELCKIGEIPEMQELVENRSDVSPITLNVMQLGDSRRGNEHADRPPFLPKISEKDLIMCLAEIFLLQDRVHLSL